MPIATLNAFNLLLLRLMGLLWLLLVALGDLVANIAATDSTCDGGQLAAVTAADLIADQASYYSPMPMPTALSCATGAGAGAGAGVTVDAGACDGSCARARCKEYTGVGAPSSFFGPEEEFPTRFNDMTGSTARQFAVAIGTLIVAR